MEQHRQKYMHVRKDKERDAETDRQIYVCVPSQLQLKTPSPTYVPLTLFTQPTNKNSSSTRQTSILKTVLTYSCLHENFSSLDYGQ